MPPPPPPKMNQAQLNAALSDLETTLREGEAELKTKPAQFEMVKSLYAELKKLKPGQTPPAKLTALLQSFLSTQIDDEMREETKRLQEAQASKSPLAPKVSAAHQSVLEALSQSRQGLAALSATAPAAAVKDAATRMNNANDAAAAAVRDAEAAQAFTKK